MGKGDLDSFRIERVLYPAIHLPTHSPLFEWLGLDATLDHHGRVRKLVHAQHLQRRKNIIRKQRIPTQVLGDPLQYPHHFINALSVRDSDIKHIVGGILRQVLHLVDDTIRDHVEITGQVAELNGSQKKKRGQATFLTRPWTSSSPQLNVRLCAKCEESSLSPLLLTNSKTEEGLTALAVEGLRKVR